MTATQRLKFLPRLSLIYTLFFSPSIFITVLFITILHQTVSINVFSTRLNIIIPIASTTTVTTILISQ